MTQKRTLQLLLGVLLALGFYARSLLHDPPIDDGLDGPYYYQVARNVAEGRGLLTNVSLYHQGLEPLPQPSTVYPAWPWVLGKVGAWIGLETAGAMLPRWLYLLDMLLLYWIAVRLTSRWWRTPETGWRFFAPHVAMLPLAANPILFWAAVRPYTETLALTFVLGALLMFDVAIVSRHRWRWAWWGLTGILAGLCYATRYQLVTVPCSLILALILAGPRRYLFAWMALAVGAAIPLGAVAAHLSSQPGFHPSVLLEFHGLQQLPGLPPFILTVPTASSLEKFQEVGRGVIASLNPFETYSYWASFSGWFLFPFIGAVWLLRHPKNLVSHVRRWLEPNHLVCVASVIVGLSSVIPLHFIHAAYWAPWLFGWRHGLPFLFVVLPALGFLATRPWPAMQLPVLGLVLLSTGHSEWKVSHSPINDNPYWRSAQWEVAKWLDEQTTAPTVLAFEPQPLSVHTRANFHWLACWASPELAELLLKHRRIDYVLLRDGQLACDSLSRVRSQLQPFLEVREGTRITVYKIKG